MIHGALKMSTGSTDPRSFRIEEIDSNNELPSHKHLSSTSMPKTPKAIYQCLCEVSNCRLGIDQQKCLTLMFCTNTETTQQEAKKSR